MKFVIPTILLGTVVGMFLLVIQPIYADVGEVKSRIAALDRGLENLKQALALRDELLDRYNSVSNDDLARLQRFLPDHVDNVRLILEIANVAANHGLAMSNIQLQGESTSQDLGPSGKPYGSINLNLALKGAYRSFRNFAQDLERSLRLVDITGISFSAEGTEEEGLDNDTYELSLRTYWLKE